MKNSPPGSTLSELLQERGLTQVEFSILIGRPLKTVNELIKGKARITERTAVQFETALGVSAEFWLAREWQYRLSIERERSMGELAKMKEKCK